MPSSPIGSSLEVLYLDTDAFVSGSLEILTRCMYVVCNTLMITLWPLIEVFYIPLAIMIAPVIVVLSPVIEVLAVAIPTLMAVAFVILAERRTMASMQRRLGPNIVG